MRAVIIALAVLVVGAAAAIPLLAVDRVHREEAPVAAVSAPANLDKEAVERIVHDYLIAYPEVLQQAYAALETKQAAEEDAKRSSAIADQKSVIYDSAHQVVLGNPKGAVTLVEFFDYNCGYCKRALPDMVRLMEKNPDLRVVLKEFPVLGRGSSEAAQVAIAVNAVAPERYNEFHEKLLGAEGPADRAAALAVVQEMGLPVDAVTKAMEAPEVAQTIEEVYGLASSLGINGTPSFVVGDKVIVGAVGYDTLAERIDTTRKCAETQSC